jgi:hypothetical protein
VEGKGSTDALPRLDKELRNPGPSKHLKSPSSRRSSCLLLAMTFSSSKALFVHNLTHDDGAAGPDLDKALP